MERDSHSFHVAWRFVKDDMDFFSKKSSEYQKQPRPAMVSGAPPPCIKNSPPRAAKVWLSEKEQADLKAALAAARNGRVLTADPLAAACKGRVLTPYPLSAPAAGKALPEKPASPPQAPPSPAWPPPAGKQAAESPAPATLPPSRRALVLKQSGGAPAFKSNGKSTQYSDHIKARRLRLKQLKRKALLRAHKNRAALDLVKSRDPAPCGTPRPAYISFPNSRALNETVKGRNPNRLLQLIFAFMYVSGNGKRSLGLYERRRATDWLGINLKSVNQALDGLCRIGWARREGKKHWALRLPPRPKSNYTKIPLVDDQGRSVLKRGYDLQSHIHARRREKSYVDKMGVHRDKNKNEIPLKAPIPDRTARYRRAVMRRQNPLNRGRQEIGLSLYTKIQIPDLYQKDYRSSGFIRFSGGRKIPWQKTKAARIVLSKKSAGSQQPEKQVFKVLFHRGLAYENRWTGTYQLFKPFWKERPRPGSKQKNLKHGSCKDLLSRLFPVKQPP